MGFTEELSSGPTVLTARIQATEMTGRPTDLSRKSGRMAQSLTDGEGQGASSGVEDSQVSEVVQVHQYDPFHPGQGGGVAWVHRIVCWLTSHGIRTTVLGIRRQPPPANGSSDLRFLPIQTRKEGAGWWWTFLLKLSLRLPRIRFSSRTVIHTHRAYFLLPFIFLKPHPARVCTLHGQPAEWVDANIRSRPLKLLLNAVRRPIETFCLRRSHALIAVSEHVRRGFEQTYPWTKGQIQTLQTPVDLQQYVPGNRPHLRETLGLNIDGHLVLYAGRFSKQKDVPLLIRAWAIVERTHPDAHLLIIGSGPEKPLIEETIRQEGVERITFLGEQPPTLMPQFMAAVDVLVLSSIYEGSPTVVREALACGTPVVSPPVGDVEEVLPNPLAGRVTPRSPEGIATGLLEVLEQDPDRMWSLAGQPFTLSVTPNSC